MYKIVNLENGIFYVGSSKEFPKRIDRHFRDLRKGEHHCFTLQKSYNENPNNFKVESFSFDTLTEAREKEQDILDSDYNNIYNLSKHSTCGDLISYHPRKEEITRLMSKSLKNRMANLSEEERKSIYGKQGEGNPMYSKTHTRESKEKMSSALMGNLNAKGSVRSAEHKKTLSICASKRVGIKNPFYGRTHSEETKKTLSEKMLGKTPTNVRKVTVDGVEYESATSASRNLGVVPATILHRIKSKNVKYRDYHYID
jgi:group I intron endonuclease